MIVLFAIIFGIATLSLSSIINDLQVVIDARVERRSVSQVEDAARLAKLHLAIYNRYPSSEAALISFAQSIGERINTDTLNYVYVPTVNGTQYQYERVIIYVQNRKEVLIQSEFESLNTCGTGLNDDRGYCAPLGAKYTVLDSSWHYQNVLRTINFRMNESFFKIAQSYDGRTVGFPRTKSNGVDMPIDSSVTIAEFVGYTGSAQNCTGTFQFSRMFLNCSDLFDELGNPIIYFYKNSREIFLIAQTSIRDQSGQLISVSRYARV